MLDLEDARQTYQVGLGAELSSNDVADSDTTLLKRGKRVAIFSLIKKKRVGLINKKLTKNRYKYP
jgi:hypothetical protein